MTTAATVDGNGVQPETPPRVLIVDDEPSISSMVETRLARDGADCLIADSAEEAIHRLETRAFDVVVADVCMPGMSGLELTRRIKASDPLVQVIIMTGQKNVSTPVEAIRIGADDYLLKPFELEQLAHSVGRRLEHRRLVLKNRAYREELEERVEEQARRLDRMYLASVRALVNALEAKDPHTQGHSERVARYAESIAHALGGPDLERLQVGAQLHDIGKIGMRDEVLLKPGPLTPIESDHVRRHPLIGTRILAPILADSVILGVVRHHHERWDGTGYPDGLAGDAIPLPARIVGVADALDAMTSPRSYRAAREWDAALAELADNRAVQFGPDVVDAALAALPERPALLGVG